MQADARTMKADPVGQVKRGGATPWVTPCLHNGFSAPSAPGRDAAFCQIPCTGCRLGWRQAQEAEIQVPA